MANKGFGHGTKLQAFVTESCLPSGSEEERGCEGIFSEGADRLAADGFDGAAADSVARAGAPGYAVGVFRAFHNVDEGVEGLA